MSLEHPVYSVCTLITDSKVQTRWSTRAGSFKNVVNLYLHNFSVNFFLKLFLIVSHLVITEQSGEEHAFVSKSTEKMTVIAAQR